MQIIGLQQINDTSRIYTIIFGLNNSLVPARLTLKTDNFGIYPIEWTSPLNIYYRLKYLASKLKIAFFMNQLVEISTPTSEFIKSSNTRWGIKNEPKRANRGHNESVIETLKSA